MTAVTRILLLLALSALVSCKSCHRAQAPVDLLTLVDQEAPFVIWSPDLFAALSDAEAFTSRLGGPQPNNFVRSFRKRIGGMLSVDLFAHSAAQKTGLSQGTQLVVFTEPNHRTPLVMARVDNQDTLDAVLLQAAQNVDGAKVRTERVVSGAQVVEVSRQFDTQTVPVFTWAYTRGVVVMTLASGRRALEALLARWEAKPPTPAPTILQHTDFAAAHPTPSAGQWRFYLKGEALDPRLAALADAVSGEGAANNDGGDATVWLRRPQKEPVTSGSPYPSAALAPADGVFYVLVPEPTTYQTLTGTGLPAATAQGLAPLVALFWDDATSTPKVTLKSGLALTVRSSPWKELFDAYRTRRVMGALRTLRLSAVAELATAAEGEALLTGLTQQQGAVTASREKDGVVHVKASTGESVWATMEGPRLVVANSRAELQAVRTVDPAKSLAAVMKDRPVAPFVEGAKGAVALVRFDALAQLVAGANQGGLLGGLLEKASAQFARVSDVAIVADTDSAGVRIRVQQRIP